MTTTIGTQFRNFTHTEEKVSPEESEMCDFVNTPTGVPCPNEADYDGVCELGHYNMKACSNCVHKYYTTPKTVWVGRCHGGKNDNVPLSWLPRR